MMPEVERALTAEAVGELALRQPEEILTWALQRFGSRFAVVTAFQAEGMVIIDMARRLDPQVRVATVDTGRLPEETYEVIETVRAQLRVGVEVIAPVAEEVEAMVSAHGPNLFRRDQALRQTCCQLRKVNPLNRFLRGLDAWATGLRRDTGPSRTNVAKVALDLAHGGMVKINPLADWTKEQVWEYVRANRLPEHPLYRQGYTSIGCAPCTRAVLPGEGERAGRWWWESDERRECGIHQLSPATD
jgi:phosphoadenosine phosphosulfate reductase